MARTRNIKPGFFKNEQLAELPMAARLLFAGLWTIADRDGRLEDRPKRIKAEVFPYDNQPIDRLLSALDKAGFITRYAVGESRFISIPTWDKHQNPHVKEPASIIPKPGKSGLTRQTQTRAQPFRPLTVTGRRPRCFTGISMSRSRRSWNYTGAAESR
jgi:hypothetical protein